MPEIGKYIIYTAVVLIALILGRWYSKERDALMANGEPWIHSWKTIPGILILGILLALIIARVWLGHQ